MAMMSYICYSESNDTDMLPLPHFSLDCQMHIVEPIYNIELGANDGVTEGGNTLLH